MPLPLMLGIGAVVTGITGLGAAGYGAAKMKDANDTMKAAKSRHEDNIVKFERKNKDTTSSMDKLGKKELEILSSFSTFSEILEKIQNKPEFKEYLLENVSLPKYDAEEIKKVSVGAGVLMGGISGAALGTAGGFAAAGATTAAVMAFGTASTGAAISGLTGIAATNATLAALGGGAIAAGGGGIALGTTVLGVTTLGVGLLVGGLIFSVTGSSLSNKADAAWAQMKEAEKEINKICAYLDDLKKTSSMYYNTLHSIDMIYRRYLNALDAIVNINKKTDWIEFTPQEQLVLENTVLLVQLLYKMCQVKLVIPSQKENNLNKINKSDIDEAIKNANNFVNTREL